MKSTTSSLILLTTVAALVAPLPSLAAPDVKSLFSTKDVEVISVSKNPEKAFDAASSIFVLSQNDIKRSGATTIPEALRLVPGLEVARIDSHTWAITSRGFNRQFANKLLVMIDGRTVYNQLFSGTYWDMQDVVMEDIDRIEVIKGPGATLWGANAVNGVINIITKDARLTQGALLSATYGNEEKGTLVGRYGGKIGNDMAYRVYSKYFDRDSAYKLNGDDAENSWTNAGTGFRVDWQKTARETFTFQGDVAKGSNEHPLTLPGIASTVDGDEDTNQANIMAKWNNKISNDSDIQLQASLDYLKRDVIGLTQEFKTFDMDFQHTWTGIKNNEVTWGLGYRLLQDDLTTAPIGGTTYLDYTPDSSTNNLYSAFLQDKIALVSDKLFLTVGSKLEHNYYTGFEVQPSARISWLATDKQTLWGSVSRAVRTPSRAEESIALVVGQIGPFFLRQIGNSNMESEDLLAYEIGYRVRPTSNISFDVSTFYNVYSNLRSYEPNGTVNIPLANNGYGDTYGVELASDWGVTNNWHLSAGYSLLFMDLNVKPGSTDPLSPLDSKSSPKHQFKLSSHLNLPHNVGLDNMLYYVDSLDAPVNVADYLRFDTSINWEMKEGVELSLVGQNLFDDRHQEFSPALYAVPNEIGRSFYGKVTLRF
jgi:iron complex outermembrane recepter protein